MTPQLGKILIITGLMITLVGGVVYILARTGFKGLPGDIHIERGGASFTFPIVTCVVLSIILTVVINLIMRR